MDCTISMENKEYIIKYYPRKKNAPCFSNAVSMRLLLFILLFCQYLLLPAQTTQYVVKHYNTENGLPQNSITKIVKDSSGFLWIATYAGVVRFDGKNFFPIIENKVNNSIVIPTGLWNIDGTLYLKDSKEMMYRIMDNLYLKKTDSFDVKNVNNNSYYDEYNGRAIYKTTKSDKLNKKVRLVPIYCPNKNEQYIIFGADGFYSDEANNIAFSFRMPNTHALGDNKRTFARDSNSLYLLDDGILYTFVKGKIIKNSNLFFTGNNAPLLLNKKSFIFTSRKNYYLLNNRTLYKVLSFAGKLLTEKIADLDF